MKDTLLAIILVFCFINDALKCLMITQSPNKTFYERNGVLLENPSGNEVLKFVAPSNRKYWLEFSNVDVINKIANVLKIYFRSVDGGIEGKITCAYTKTERKRLSKEMKNNMHAICAKLSNNNITLNRYNT